MEKHIVSAGGITPTGLRGWDGKGRDGEGERWMGLHNKQLKLENLVGEVQTPWIRPFTMHCILALYPR
jgi:hypothetical protein